MPYYDLTVLARRDLGGLALLTLEAPDLARAARPGQALLLRCAPAGAEDPLLRRAAYLAGADPAAGSVTLLIDPAERGLAWLAARHPGDLLDAFGPLGAGFSLDPRSRNLLLAGIGPGLPALIFLAAAAVARGGAAVLLAAAPAADRLPPPYLLPADVEYQSSPAGPEGLAGLITPAALAWADQACLAGPPELVVPLAGAVRAGRLRWAAGFAQMILDGPMPCVSASCQACLVETRERLLLRCKDGPVFDLRDLR